MAKEKPGFRSTFKQRFSYHHRGQIGKGRGGVKAASLEMSTRSLATRLKRLEFRSGPALERPQIEICLVDSKAKVLYKMRLGPARIYTSLLTTNRYPRRKPTGCLRLQQRRICHESNARRLHRLEDQFGSPSETEYDLWLRQRLEAAERRIEEARKRGELPPAEEERLLTEFKQRRLEDLKRAAWNAKLRADRRSKV